MYVRSVNSMPCGLSNQAGRQLWLAVCGDGPSLLAWLIGMFMLLACWAAIKYGGVVGRSQQLWWRCHCRQLACRHVLLVNGLSLLCAAAALVEHTTLSTDCSHWVQLPHGLCVGPHLVRQDGCWASSHAM